jgi:hypothetical protein
MDFERSGNLAEAALWFAVSLTFVVKTALSHGRLRAVFLILAVAFAVFGITDLVESETGAWWRPLWLLGLKAACVSGFVVGFVAYYRITRRNRNELEKNNSS